MLEINAQRVLPVGKEPGGLADSGAMNTNPWLAEVYCSYIKSEGRVFFRDKATSPYNPEQPATAG